jgi:hypothetical protein
MSDFREHRIYSTIDRIRRIRINPVLSTLLKVTTKSISRKVTDILSVCDEEQDFGRGQSCTNAIFTIKQITEKKFRV